MEYTSIRLFPQSRRLLIIVRRPPRDLRRRRLRSRHINRRLLLNLLLPRNPSIPIQRQCAKNVEDDKGPHDTKVAPAGRVLRAELCQVDVSVSSSTELAISCGAFVGEVTTCCVDVGGHVLPACLAGARIEGNEFNGGADDGVIGQTGGEHAIDEVCEGRYAVHEDPEAWESGGTSENTVGFVSDGWWVFRRWGKDQRLTR